MLAVGKRAFAAHSNQIRPNQRQPNMYIPRCAIAMLSLAGLSGCGAVAGQSLFSDTFRLQQINAAIAENNSPLTSRPTSGDVTMTGAILLSSSMDSSPSLVGEARMVAEFGSDKIRGSARDFVLTTGNEDTSNSRSVGGALTFSGAINMADGHSAIDGSVTGTIDVGEGTTPFNNGEIRGGFYATDLGIASTGVVTGQVATSGGTETVGGGYSVAER